MRILYINSYQGEDLVKERSVSNNRALGGSRKVELICSALKREGHDVVVLSSGIPANGDWKCYRSFESTVPSADKSGARVFYSSCVDFKLIKYIPSLISSFRFMRREAKIKPFDAIMIYNFDEYPFVMSLLYHLFIKQIPIVLEYEDSVEVDGRGVGFIRRAIWKTIRYWLSPRLRGILGVNTKLTNTYCKNDNRFNLPGIVSGALCDLSLSKRPPLSGGKPYLAVFSGSLLKAKGAQHMILAAKHFKGRVKFVVSGTGPMYEELIGLAANCGGNVDVVGCLERKELDELLASADILVNPHEDEKSGGIQPLKLIEYLVAGGVVITTKHADSRDEVYDYCELTYPSAEAVAKTIEKVLEQPEQMVVRAKKGQMWAISHYSESAVSEKLDRLMLSAISS